MLGNMEWRLGLLVLVSFVHSMPPHCSPVLCSHYFSPLLGAIALLDIGRVSPEIVPANLFFGDFVSLISLSH